MTPSKPKHKMPWELASEQATSWADDFMVRWPMAAQAQAEGWADRLRNFAFSYAKNSLQAGHAPSPSWAPDAETIKYWRGWRAKAEKEVPRAHHQDPYRS